MGRWGYRLFEGDRDLDLAIGIGKSPFVELTHLVHQTDMICPQDIRAYYKTDEYARVLEAYIVEARTDLNAHDTGNKTFVELMRKMEGCSEGPQKVEATYNVVLFGALMMRCGARITDEQKATLMDLANVTPVIAPSSNPLQDETGFRQAGKLQFVTALENYQNGTPRNFAEPSCFNCGKISADRPGKPPLKPCSDKCNITWYCNNVCKAANHDTHQQICRNNLSGRALITLNV